MFISVLSQKGGVGKSTVARGLAVECLKNDLDVGVADMDYTQLSTLHWAQCRRENGIGPAVAVESCQRAPDALAMLPDHDVLIADGTPYATETGVALAARSDWVIIPTGSSIDDLRPAIQMAEELVLLDKIPIGRIIMVVTKVPKGGDRDAMQAKKNIQECGYLVTDTWLTYRTAYSQAMDRGHSICETWHRELNTQAIRIFEQLGEHFIQGER